MPDPATFPNPVPEDATEVAFCPVCDRSFHATTERSAQERCTQHIIGQHPDYQNEEWLGGESA